MTESKNERYAKQLKHIADEIERLRLLIFQNTPKDDEMRDEINDKLFSLQSQLRYDVAEYMIPFDEYESDDYVPRTFYVHRVNDDVIVGLYKNKADGTFSFVNHTKGHVCTCKFESEKAAIADLEKCKQEGSVIWYEEN